MCAHIVILVSHVHDLVPGYDSGPESRALDKTRRRIKSDWEVSGLPRDIRNLNICITFCFFVPNLLEKKKRVLQSSAPSATLEEKKRRFAGTKSVKGKCSFALFVAGIDLVFCLFALFFFSQRTTKPVNSDI